MRLKEPKKEWILKTEPKRLYERWVIEDILDLCDIGIRDAVKYVKASRFYSSLQEDRQTTMHYFPKEWSDSVINQFNLKRK